MIYNKQEHSELERRFEVLFSQVSRAPWQEYLTAQYPVQVDGKTYYIDYVYEDSTGIIGLELDGRGKFYQHKQVFNNFFNRQNAIQRAGITLYRFTWTDVVEQGGWRARKQLHQIFQGKFTDAAPNHTNPPWPPEQERSTPDSREVSNILGIGVVALIPMLLIGTGIMGLIGIRQSEVHQATNNNPPIEKVAEVKKVSSRTTQAQLKKKTIRR